MRNLQRRLKKLETWRVNSRVPRIMVRYEHPDGSVEINESRPSEGDSDETIKVIVQYVDQPPKTPLNSSPGATSDGGGASVGYR